jgi:hypothetical protein
VQNWLDSDSDDRSAQDAFSKEQFEGSKGHMRLQLQKTYQGDERFKLDKSFNVSKNQKLLPDQMKGAMSKRERDLLFAPTTSKPEEGAKSEGEDVEG